MSAYDPKRTSHIKTQMPERSNSTPGSGKGGQVNQQFRRQFDVFYCEGEASGRVMATCLHSLLIGHPHRIGALDSALEYI